jgi:hypothetical protein
MQDETESILQHAVNELAESTGVDADSVARVLRGLGLREVERLDTFRRGDEVITARDLHVSISVGDVVVSM